MFTPALTVALWIKAYEQLKHVRNAGVSPFEIKHLNELGEIYDERTLWAMLKAFAEHMRRTDYKADWNLYTGFYMQKNRWLSEAGDLSAPDPNSLEALEAEFGAGASAAAEITGPIERYAGEF